MTDCEGVIQELGDLLYESYSDKAKKSEKDKTLDGVEMGRVVISTIIKRTGDKILHWLAGIAELDYEAFDNAGPGKLAEVITHLSKQEGLSDFFAAACALFPEQKRSESNITPT